MLKKALNRSGKLSSHKLTRKQTDLANKMTSNNKNLIKSTFLKLKEHLNPEKLVQAQFQKYLSNEAKIDLQAYKNNNSKIHVFGFGKAVYGMTLGIQSDLKKLYGFDDDKISIEINIPESQPIDENLTSTAVFGKFRIQFWRNFEMR